MLKGTPGTRLTRIYYTMEWRCGAKSMQGRRSSQEDKHIIIQDFTAFVRVSSGDQKFRFPPHFHPAVLLGLLDGHMGAQASTFCCKQLPIEIAKQFALLFSSSSVEPQSSIDHSHTEGTLEKLELPEPVCVHELRTSPNTALVVDGLATVDDGTHRDARGKRERSSEKTDATPFEKRHLSDEPHECGAQTGSKPKQETVSSSSLEPCTPSNTTEGNILDPSHSALDPIVLDTYCKAITKAFTLTDELFLRTHRLNKDGSTVSIVLLLGSHIFTAWLGDSRVVLGSERHVGFEIIAPNIAVETRTQDADDPKKRTGGTRIHSESCPAKWRSSSLSDDHKPSRIDEKKRILEAGGQVLNTGGVFRVARGDFQAQCRRVKQMNCFYLGGGARQSPMALAVSRSMGDREFKVGLEKSLIISTPEIRYFYLSTLLDKAIILACDGIWDVLKEQEVVDLFNTYVVDKGTEDCEAGASSIVKTAFQKGSQDNLTLVYAYLVPKETLNTA